MPDDWPFTDPENALVITLKRVLRRESAVLRVCHDEDDGAWQFLDGGEVATEEAAAVTLRQITQIDSTLLELADLPLGWVATRSSPDRPWQRAPAVSGSDWERKLISDVEEHGWHVTMVPEDDEGPGFAYSVGLFQNFAHPEIIMFGLDLNLMHRIINRIGEEVRQGHRFIDGAAVSGFIEGFDVRFVRVARRHYPDYLGGGSWFYKHSDFPALQCVWPDKQGRFPMDPDWPEWLRTHELLLDH